MTECKENETLRKAWKLGNALVKYRNRRLLDYGLTSVQAEIVTYLLRNRDKDEITLHEIQEYLMLTHPTVSGIVRRLEKNGFLTLAQSKTDGRYTSLKLTPKGLHINEVLRENATQNEALLLRNMTAAERREFFRLLSIALENMSD